MVSGRASPDVSGGVSCRSTSKRSRTTLGGGQGALSAYARIAQGAAVQSLHRELAGAKRYSRLRGDASPCRTRPLDHVVQRMPANTDLPPGDIFDQELWIGSFCV